MPRYRPKTIYSPHSKRRYDERFDGDEPIEELARKANGYGIRPEQVPDDSPLRRYVEDREAKKDKAIRLYMRFVYIFSKNKRLITMYPIPEELLEAYSELAPLETENREKYRQYRRQYKHRQKKYIKG